MNRIRTAIVVGAALTALSLFADPAYADTMNEEIDYLISSVGKSRCTFIRNGKRYSRSEARYHLRSKRRRNAHLIDSTEEFIERIASRSVSSGQPYRIRCRGEEEQNAGDWFAERLDEYRATQS